MENNKSYSDFLTTISDEIRNAQYKAFRSINYETINLYWSIGKQISDKQKELGWGNSVISELSKDLQKEFQSKSTFSLDNLQRMRQLYLEYSDFTISGQLVPKLINILQPIIPKLPEVLGQPVPKPLQDIDIYNFNSERSCTLITSCETGGK